MSQRGVRVNELIKREISHLLHTHYRDEAVRITVTEVEVAPDLRKARVYYSVLGGDTERSSAASFLARRRESIRREVGKVVRLKYLPHLRFIFDASLERGARLTRLIDELEEDSEPAAD